MTLETQSSECLSTNRLPSSDLGAGSQSNLREGTHATREARSLKAEAAIESAVELLILVYSRVKLGLELLRAVAVRMQRQFREVRPKRVGRCFDCCHRCVTSRSHSCLCCFIPAWGLPPTQVNPGHQALDCYPMFLGFSRGKSNRS